MIHRGGSSHDLTAPTGQSDGESPHLLRDSQSTQHILTRLALGDGDSNVLRMRQGSELIGAYVVSTVAMHEASEGGNIIGEGNCRERTFP
jgi:hypothetical protein